MEKLNNSLEINDLILIERLFPFVNWQKVIIKQGMPWYLKNSFATAAALPKYFDRNLEIVYRTHNDRSLMLDTLYHETVHIQQYQDLDKKFPFGIGFFRAFMMHYLGWTLALFFNGIFIKKLNIRDAVNFAYTENPLEKEAYRKGGIFFQAIISKLPVDIIKFLEDNPQIKLLKSDYKGYPPIWAFTIAILLCLLIFITKPVLDLIAFVFGIAQNKFRKSA